MHQTLASITFVKMCQIDRCQLTTFASGLRGMAHKIYILRSSQEKENEKKKEKEKTKE